MVLTVIKQSNYKLGATVCRQNQAQGRVEFFLSNIAYQVHTFVKNCLNLMRKM